MKHVFLLSLLAGMILLTGCPYESGSPLDDGSYTIPAWMNGKWKEVKDNGKGDMYVLTKGGKTGLLNASELDSNGRISTPKKIIMSKVGNKIFMNVYDGGDDEGGSDGYYIYQFKRISDKEFEIWPLKENSDIKTLSDLKDFLLKNENNDDIYEMTDKGSFKKM